MGTKSIESIESIADVYKEYNIRSLSPPRGDFKAIPQPSQAPRRQSKRAAKREWKRWERGSIPTVSCSR